MQCCITTQWLTNPKKNDGETPFHAAARNGHFEICVYIMGKIKNKNPGDDEGFTPHHSAAHNGHLNISEHIMARIENQNPRLYKLG